MHLRTLTVDPLEYAPLPPVNIRLNIKDWGSPGGMPHQISKNVQICAKNKGFENAFIFWWRIKMETESTWELIWVLQVPLGDFIINRLYNHILLLVQENVKPFFPLKNI